MAKYKFKRDWYGHRAGHVISTGDLREGIVRTLLSFNAIEKVEDELDTETNVKPTKSGSKSRRSKVSSKGSGKRSGSDAATPNRGSD